MAFHGLVAACTRASLDLVILPCQSNGLWGPNSHNYQRVDVGLDGHTRANSFQIVFDQGYSIIRSIIIPSPPYNLETLKAQKVPGSKSSPVETPTNSKGMDAHDTQGTAANEAVNIIVCGQAGFGKSSLINMLAGNTVAKTSNGMAGCTSESNSYPITTPNNRKITLWDTAGLDQRSESTAMKNLCQCATLLTESTGLSLVIYLMRSRPNHDITQDYLMFKAFCKDKVPFVLVVTALDGESDRAGWWNRNEGHFREVGLLGDGHACIVTTKDRNSDKAYADSALEVFKLIEDNYLREPWKAGSRSQEARRIFKRQASRSASEATPTNGINVNPQDNQNKTTNIIVCGVQGVGKSSLVNMLASGPTEVARTSNDTIGCTFKSEPYSLTTPSGRKLTLWDTAGLDEGPTGRVTTLAAMKNIRELTTQLADSTGLSLIIYMVRGRLVGSIRKNYVLFKAFCDDKVPFVIVVTGLDGESDRAGWWSRNEGHFREAGLLGDGHACIVSAKDRNNDKAYADSAREVLKLIEEKAYLRDPWMVDKKNWFIQAVINVMELLFGSQSSKALLEGLMANGVPEDEARDAVKIFKSKYKIVDARATSP
ncbi:hypothetical protein FIBSPDRAFT_931233 [Athelia psychrophila]|uniref:G domain-containing protein n=1 Tax=Athelia psychrophila TaxID=1759441 RepID=A0A166KTB9_9AGAM|nr:hypothetical protein FIBSPDRAFT_931233 [Fibularhizoctonia sp. CBS 109695]